VSWNNKEKMETTCTTVQQWRKPCNSCIFLDIYWNIFYF